MTLLAAIDPGRSKCGLALADPSRGLVLEAGILSAERSRSQLERWLQHGGCDAVLLGNGTGSGPWQPWLRERTRLILVPEAGTTLAARKRYWQLEPARGWRRLLPEGLRLPPRDVDDVVAQLLLERQLNQTLVRPDGLTLLERQG